jgi:hypothetical protein
MEEDSLCPKCYEGKLVKPKVFYRVFEGRRQPDFICDHCGAPSWELPEVEIPSIKKKEVPKRKEEEKFDWKRYV